MYIKSENKKLVRIKFYFKTFIKSLLRPTIRSFFTGIFIKKKFYYPVFYTNQWADPDQIRRIMFKLEFKLYAVLILIKELRMLLTAS